jgi:uncharacterized membrane protein
MAKQPQTNPKANHLPGHQSAQPQLVSAQWQGPLPPPESLSQFDTIIPNGAERIMAMVEAEQVHRINYETIHLNALASDTRRGHWLGAAISILGMLGSAATAYIGADWRVSVALVGVPILGIVKSIVSSRTAK